MVAYTLVPLGQLCPFPSSWCWPSSLSCLPTARLYHISSSSTSHPRSSSSTAFPGADQPSNNPCSPVQCRVMQCCRHTGWAHISHTQWENSPHWVLCKTLVSRAAFTVHSTVLKSQKGTQFSQYSSKPVKAFCTTQSAWAESQSKAILKKKKKKSFITSRWVSAIHTWMVGEAPYFHQAPPWPPAAACNMAGENCCTEHREFSMGIGLQNGIFHSACFRPSHSSCLGTWAPGASGTPPPRLFSTREISTFSCLFSLSPSSWKQLELLNFTQTTQIWKDCLVALFLFP